MTNYINAKCWKCDCHLVVASHDLAERNYCQSCAWDKLALGRIPTSKETDV